METMRDKLTVVVQTSPIPSHPSTALIEALFRSFTKADGLLESRVIILADGCEESKDDERENVKHGKASSETASNYRKFLKNLKDLVENRIPPFCPINGGSIELLQLSERYGSAPAIRCAMDTVVSAPLVMVCQHDNFFINPAPLRQVVDAMCDTPGLGIDATCIHFLSTATMNYQEKVKLRYNLDLPPVHVEGLDHPLVPLAFWYGRSHVSYSSYVRDYALNRELPKGSHLEELLGQSQLDAIISDPKSHKNYGTYVLDQQVEVIYHLSGRRARRATTEEEQNENNRKSCSANNSSNMVPQPTVMEGAFTSARTCRATIPGLVFMSEGEQQDERKQLPKKFKGRCFHCNERGHSKIHCPRMTSADKRRTEVIDLS
mmetsp:Transcript_60295/g.147964  ORF Transcript_60295/g.147964 Transcript_60295/m.147964 type:complete len:376 (-) Transcript_60295:120-1247(-)